MSKIVITHVSHAKRFSHLVEVAEGIRDQTNRGLRRFRGSISVAVALWATCALRTRLRVAPGVAGSEAATAADWANCQVEADSVATAAALLPVDAAARQGLAV
jgi:hypothetical protein